MKVARRGFLGLLASAPIAGPAAAREVAEKMGLRSALVPGARVTRGVTDLTFEDGPYRESSMSRIGWVRDRIKNLFSEEAVRNRRERAVHHAMYLDMDLACMHSMSASARYEIQIERLCQKMAEEDRISWERELEQLLSGKGDINMPCESPMATSPGW